MALYYWESDRHRGYTNLGDNLNPWLLGHVLGQAVLEAPNNTVVGIGTILNVEAQVAIGPDSIKSVFTSGCGYSALPTVDASWRFYAVRGRISHRLLHLEDVPLGDGAILISDYLGSLNLDGNLAKGEVIFMPHVDLAVENGEAWRRACEDAGVTYFSPAEPQDRLISALVNARLVITSAMHCAIIADAVRTPWIAVSSSSINTGKWKDWASALDLEFHFHAIPQFQPTGSDLGGRIKRRLARAEITKALRARSKLEGQLSDERLLNSRKDGLRRAAARLKDDFGSAL